MTDSGFAELEDVVQGVSIMEPRVTRWSDAAADIRALCGRGARMGPWPSRKIAGYS